MIGCVVGELAGLNVGFTVGIDTRSTAESTVIF